LEQYQELKKNKSAEDKIYFMDGTHPLHNSQLGYGWIGKGKEKFVKANTGRARVNINGAYNIEEHKPIVREDESINAQSTIALMKQIQEQQQQGKIYLIADNARYYHSKLVSQYLQQNERIEIIFLPPYSPNLNLIERLWKWMKKKVAYNRYYEEFSVFREKIMEVLGNSAQYRQALENLMTENFQLFPA
jgi:transposase